MFQIFDAHLSHFRPSERGCFDALLPLLRPAARSEVHPFIRTPGVTPYSKARQVPLRHFGSTPRQLACEFRETRSLGKRLPSELLDNVRGIDPRELADAQQHNHTEMEEYLSSASSSLKLRGCALPDFDDVQLLCYVSQAPEPPRPDIPPEVYPRFGSPGRQRFSPGFAMPICVAGHGVPDQEFLPLLLALPTLQCLPPHQGSSHRPRDARSMV